MLPTLPASLLCLFVLIQASFAAAAPVQEPVLKKQIKWTGTSWFASTIVHDLGSGNRKIIGTYYDIIVWDSEGNELARAPHGDGYPHPTRIYAPAVCADLDNDGIYEIVVASGDVVAAYEWKNNGLMIKSGWPASTCSAGECPETRGLAAADLDGDGSIEVVATTTQKQDQGAQVFVFNPDGTPYQPPNLSFQAWPRYDQSGDDATSNGPGNHGFGCYGLNVGIGNLDDDPEQEIVVTFDNHQINVFQHTGVSMLASPWFSNRDPDYLGNRLNWGQFIRWFDPQVEEDHYHLHTGTWPSPESKKWLQWTASPPSVSDLNRDGHNEVVCVANVEQGIPYETRHHSIMILEGGHGDGSRSAMRLPGWEQLPSSGPPLDRGSRSWYPPRNPPAATVVDIDGDGSVEILYAAHDGHIYCTGADGRQVWNLDITHGRAMMYGSEITVADLNQDNIPELVLTTYGDPESITPGVAHGFLMILDNRGNILHDIQLPQQGTNGNGKGAPAAPTLMDTDGDGSLEILVQTFGAGEFIFTVPGSAENLLPWPTARGSYLRDGRPAMVPGKSPTRPPCLAPLYRLLLK